MCALWHDPPYVMDPSEGIASGKFRVSELDTYDHDEVMLKDFDTFEEALAFAMTRQRERGGGSQLHRIWNDAQQVVKVVSHRDIEC